jgi:hypothetical protein
MDGYGFPLATTPFARSHPHLFKRILSTQWCSSTRVLVEQAAELARVFAALRSCSPRVAQCLRWGTGELHAPLPASMPESGSATTRPPFVQAVR